jgi:hypothetical protein
MSFHLILCDVDMESIIILLLNSIQDQQQQQQLLLQVIITKAKKDFFSVLSFLSVLFSVVVPFGRKCATGRLVDY